MPRTSRIAVLIWAGLGLAGRADDTPPLPKGSPPRLASVVKLDGDLLSYRDFSFVPLMPKQPDRFRAGEAVPALPGTGPIFAVLVDFSFKEGTVTDSEGKRLDPAEAKRRVKVGDVVLISTTGKPVDPGYLRIIKKEALILIHPPAPPGPPPPPPGDE